MSKHTPLPWKFEGTTIFAKGFVASTNGHDNGECLQCEANAAHIVKCVNMFDEFINFLQALDNDEFCNLTNEKRNLLHSLLAKATGGEG